MKIIVPRPLKRLYNAFYRGPDWIDMTPYIRFYKYRSPTLFFIAWVYAFYIRFFTVPGRIFFITSLVVFAYNLTLLDTPIRLLSFLVFGMIATDLVWGFVFRPKIKAVKNLPERCRAGYTFNIEYKIVNKRRIPAFNITMDDLQLPKALSFKNSPASISYLSGKSERRLRTQIKVSQRGKYFIHAPIAATAFPFGIFRWTCRDSRKGQILNVYPNYSKLNIFELPTSSKFQKEGTNNISNIGESLDFHACRDYRSGDNPKHIHWMSSARLNKLIVREFQQEFLNRTALIIDTYTPKPSKWDVFFMRQKKDMRLEACLSLTVSIIDYLNNSDSVVDIFAAGPDVFHFQTGRHLYNFEKILDIVAGIKANHSHPILDLSPTVMNEMVEIGSAIILLLNWDDEREKLVKRILSEGIDIKIIFLGNENKVPEIQNLKYVHPDDVINGNIKKL